MVPTCSTKFSLDAPTKNRYPPPMRTVSAHIIRLVIFLTLFLWWGRAGDFVCAQELTLSGVGPINHSLAGAAVALPRDSAGAMQWNPATISFLEKSEFQLGLGRHNAPWYGDEYAAGTIGVGVLVVGWLYLASISDNSKSDLWDWEQRRKEGNVVLVTPYLVFDFGTSNRDVSRPRQEPKSEDDSSKAPRKSAIRVPTISYVYQRPDSRWSFGLVVSEYGARKIGTVAIDDCVGIGEYHFQGYEFVPTIAYRESKRFSVGVSPIFSIDETPNATLPIIPHLAGTPVPRTPAPKTNGAGQGSASNSERFTLQSNGSASVPVCERRSGSKVLRTVGRIPLPTQSAPAVSRSRRTQHSALLSAHRTHFVMT